MTMKQLGKFLVKWGAILIGLHIIFAPLPSWLTLPVRDSGVRRMVRLEEIPVVTPVLIFFQNTIGSRLWGAICVTAIILGAILNNIAVRKKKLIL